MKKLKFAFKTIDNKEINAKNYDLTIRKNLFGNEINTIVLKNGNETKFLDMKNVISVLTGKNEIAITDEMSINHVVGIIEKAFNENNVHNRTFTSEIESDIEEPIPEPEPIDKPVEPEPQPIPPLSIVFSYPRPDNQYSVIEKPPFKLSNATGDVTLSSSDESIATIELYSNNVSDTWKVIFHKAGTVTIAATTTSGQSASVVITGYIPELILSNYGDCFVDDSGQIGINNAFGDITWSSSDESVIVVDSDGVFTCVGIGYAEITAATTSGQESSVGINVYEREESSYVILDLELYGGGEYNVGDTFDVGYNNADGEINWSSDNEDIATVDSNGTVTCVSPGHTYINANTSSGQSAYIEINVVERVK